MSPLDPSSDEWKDLAYQKVSTETALKTADATLAKARRAQRRLEVGDSASDTHDSGSSAEGRGSSSGE